MMIKPVEKLTKYVEENPIAAGVGGIMTVAMTALALRQSRMRRDKHDYDNQITGALKILNNEDHTLSKDQLGQATDSYLKKFDGARKETGTITSTESVDARRAEYKSMVDEFYNLVTDFYEWGWGQSFHFGPRFINETFDESIKRTEYHLCNRLHMKKGMKVVDVGCGVGGPMRNMAMFTGSTIKGITINEYQVKIGNQYNEKLGLDHICELVQGDFQKQPFKDGEFDAAYEIEATCHSPNRVQTYGEVYRVLKPGAYFAGYEWVMTDRYDPNNVDHVRIKEGIEVGNGLPTLVHSSEVIQDLKDAGFDVKEHYDANQGVHHANQIPWYSTLDGHMSLSGFRMTWAGRMVTHCTVWTLETLRIAAPGSTRVSQMLNQTAIDLVDGGKLEIFTPSFYFLAQKRA